MKCEKHKYKGEAAFCPDCEFDRLLNQDTEIQRSLKEDKFKKAKDYKRVSRLK